MRPNPPRQSAVVIQATLGNLSCCQQSASPEARRQETLIIAAISISSPSNSMRVALSGGGTTENRPLPVLHGIRGFETVSVPAPEHARIVPFWPPHEEDVVRAEEIEPSRHCGQRIFIPLRVSPPAEGGLETWTIPSPFFASGLGAAHLVSPPSRKCFRTWLGTTLTGSTGFEQFYNFGFPMGTQGLKVF
jgi:hypothetical protein